MAEHSLSAGRRVIAAIERLGIALGYSPKAEWPLENNAAPAAVDVVWFSEPQQQIPILMFEVESSPAASLSNNALKVLGKDNAALQKPLFLFHLIVKGGTKSSRVLLTQSHFSSHNYRIYLLAKDEATALLSDVLEQHRRLQSRLDLVGVVATVMTDWPTVNLSQFLKHIEALRFATSYLQDYALLSLRMPECKERFFEFLLNADETDTHSGCEYSMTVLGNQWSKPIHLALIGYRYPNKREEYFEKLRFWQEKSSFMSQIGPHWGLSMDYDEFLARMSPFLWALLASLFKHLPEAQVYICDRMVEVLCSMPRGDEGSFHAVWLLHVANSCRYETGFEYGRSWINESGGINLCALLAPPAVLTEESLEGDEQEGTDEVDISLIPERCQFQELLKLEFGEVKDSVSPDDIALRVLISDIDDSYAPAIVRFLGS